MPEHAELFGRAALVAREPNNFESLTQIREDERKFHWDRSSPRPARHASLTDLDF